MWFVKIWNDQCKLFLSENIAKHIFGITYDKTKFIIVKNWKLLECTKSWNIVYLYNNMQYVAVISNVESSECGCNILLLL